MNIGRTWVSRGLVAAMGWIVGCSSDESAAPAAGPGAVGALPVSLPHARVDGYLALPSPRDVVVEAHRVGRAGQRGAKLGEAKVGADGGFSFPDLDGQQGMVLLTTRGGTYDHPLGSGPTSLPTLRALVAATLESEGRCPAVLSPLSELRLALTTGKYDPSSVTHAAGAVATIASLVDDRCVIPADPFSPTSKSAPRERVEASALGLALMAPKAPSLASLAQGLESGSGANDTVILEAFGDVLSSPDNASGVAPGDTLVAAATKGLKVFTPRPMSVDPYVYPVPCGKTACSPGGGYCPPGTKTFTCSKPNTSATVRSDVPLQPAEPCGKTCSEDGAIIGCGGNFCRQYIDHDKRPDEQYDVDVCAWYLDRGDDAGACPGSEAIEGPSVAKVVKATTDEAYFALVVPSESNLEGTILVHDGSQLIGLSVERRASNLLNYEGGEKCPVGDYCFEVLGSHVADTHPIPTAGSHTFYFRTTYGYEFGWTFDVPKERGSRTFCNILDGKCETLGPPAKLDPGGGCYSACNAVAVMCGLNNAPREECVKSCTSRSEKADGLGCRALFDEVIGCCITKADASQVKEACAEESDPEDALGEGYKDCDDGPACKGLAMSLKECQGEL